MLIELRESGFATKLVGGPGGLVVDDVVGVAEASFDGLPVPTEFTAETL